MTPLNINMIPAELRDTPRWVVWKQEEGAGKVPYSAKTGRRVSIMKAEAGSEFELAHMRYREGGYSGLGFILNGDGIVAADLDDCVTDGRINPEAYEVLHSLGFGYIEYSPSGHGIHMWGRAVTKRAGRRGQINGVSIELYSDRRYITATCDAIPTKQWHGNLPILSGYDEVLRKIEQEGLAVAVATDEKLDAAPEIPPLLVNFTQEDQEVQELQEAQEFQETQEIEETDEINDAQASRPPGSAKIVFPSSCHVRKPGQRHQKLFQLARWMRAELDDPGEIDLCRYVREWHRQFVDHMRTKDFHITWIEFVIAWQHIKFPMGEVLGRAIKNPLPLEPWMSQHGLGPLAERLLSICLRLAANTSDGVFFLASRPLAQQLGCSHQLVHNHLKALVSYGYLQLMYKGHTRRASEYRIGTERVDPFAVKA